MKILLPYMARWHALNWSRYHSLLTALAELGHEVHVMQPPPLASTETNFQEIAPVQQARLHLHDVPLSPGIWNRRFPFDKLAKKAYYSWRSVEFARSLIEREKIDVLLLYNIPQFRFLGLPGVQVVFDYADDYVDMLRYELGRLSNPIAIKLAKRMLHSMMHRSQLTTTVSHVLADRVPGRAVVLPNGVSRRKVETAAAAGRKPESRRRPVVGFVGSFEYFIDFDLILDVAKSLPDVDFLLVGSGRDWPAVKARVDREALANVTLTGGVPHSEVFSRIASMDICLNVFRRIPVSERACPIKLFEYASLRKPIVSTRLAELEHVDNGFLYYGDTAQEVTTRIRQILEQPAEARTRAQAGYELVMRHYTWESIASQFISAIEASRAQG